MSNYRKIVLMGQMKRALIESIASIEAELAKLDTDPLIIEQFQLDFSKNCTSLAKSKEIKALARNWIRTIRAEAKIEAKKLKTKEHAKRELVKVKSAPKRKKW